MKYLFIFCIGLYSGCLWAQTTPTGVAAEQNLKTLGSSANSQNSVMWFNNRYQGVVGHPFLVRDWRHAELILVDGNPAFTYVKLNICKDELWAMLTTGDSIIVNNGLVRSLSFMDLALNQERTFEYFLRGRHTGYFEILYSGSSLSLLCKRRKQYIPAAISGGYAVGNPYDEFVDEKTWYYILKNDSFTLLKLKENNVSDALGHAAEKIIKDKTLDLGNEKNLVELVKDVDQSETENTHP